MKSIREPFKVLLLSLLTATLPYPTSAQDKDESETEELSDRLAGEKLLAAQVNAIAVLNMIRALEEEMQVRYMVINREIVTPHPENVKPHPKKDKPHPENVKHGFMADVRVGGREGFRILSEGPTC